MKTEKAAAGSKDRLGATLLEDGINFAVYSETASGRPQLRPGSRQVGELFAPFYGAVREYALLEGRWDGARSVERCFEA